MLLRPCRTLSRISWRTCVADLLPDHRPVTAGMSILPRDSGEGQLQQVHAVMGADGRGGRLAEGVQDADGVCLVHEAG